MLIRLPFKTFVMLSLIFILVVPNAGAQSQNPVKSLLLAQNQPAGEVDFKAANQEAVEKLRQMTAEEIEALDKKLAEALILYYDRAFARALPIFKEIAGQVETMDVMFWIGTSAMQAGETQLAIEKFKQMLEIDPKLYRVRLELAATYFRMGRYEEARLELETVQAASPPPEIRQNITKLLAAIEERTKKLFYNLRVSLGYMWDDNISSGPEDKTYTNGYTPTTVKLRDEALITNVAGNVLYDIGENRRLMWNTTFSLYNKAYSDYSEFNYMVVDFTTGPWRAGPRDILKVPFGIMESEYGSDRLSRAFHLDPNYEYHFSRRFSLKGLYSYTNENYHGDTRSYLDNENNLFELTPSFYFKNRKHIVSVSVGYEDHNAKDDQYSYADPYFACSYFVSLPTETELFFKYRYTRREYLDFPFNYTQYKIDKRQNFTAVVSQGFYKNFFASFAFGYIDNASNFELYDYDKTTYTFSVGWRF